MTLDLDELEQLARASETLTKRDVDLNSDGDWAAYCVANADFLVAANPAAVLELVQRLRAAEHPGERGSVRRLMFDLDRYRAIVRDLAAVRQPIGLGTDEQLRCSLCKGTTDGQWSDVIHAESCPWRRAIEATR
jgi:hypothetical protein